MLHLFQSNNHKVLITALLDDIEMSLLDKSELWTPCQIIIPSSAVRRRLELDIAFRYGICTNIKFSYLDQWLFDQTVRIHRDVSSQYSQFTPERLVWHCYRLLCSSVNGDKTYNTKSDEFWISSSRLTAYLSESDDMMRYELAHRIATVINHYLIYRPKWLSTWQAGKSIFSDHIVQQQHISESVLDDEQWQAALWRTLMSELVGEMLPMQNFPLAMNDFNAETIERACLPKSVSIFTLPTIPPLYAELLRQFSFWIDIRIYSLNLCKDWPNAKNKGENSDELDEAESRNYKKTYHPLLANWGQQAREQLHMLHKLMEGIDSRRRVHFVENRSPTWLARIQNAMLNLKDKSILGDLPHTHGIEVHVCHSLTRQLEVLHNLLLKLFNEDDSLKLSDVLIAMPDLSAVEPFINAVFGTSDLEKSSHIPYRITGLNPLRKNSVIRVILDWLTLPDRKVSISELIEWLRIDEISTHYEIDTVSLETVQRWLLSAGGRWGLSNNNVEINSTSRCTFSNALDRLFLGYAMLDFSGPIGTCLPISSIEGSEAELLGRVASFIENLDNLACRITKSHTPLEWKNLFFDIFIHFFDLNSTYSSSLNEARQTLDNMLASMIEAAPDNPIPASVVRAGLISTLGVSMQESVPCSGITFSSMTNLRGLAYRIICLIDMGEEAILGCSKRTEEFDLTAILPKLGDKQHHADERNLFLDFLLASSDLLLITYTGHSVIDNSILSPSLLVDELLDHLSIISVGPDSSEDMINAARRSFIIEHPLQSFSPVYFDRTSEFFSYNTQHASISTLLINNEILDSTKNIVPFFLQPLPAEKIKKAEFSDFDRFWKNPTRTLLRDQLGIKLIDIQSELLNNEPFEYNSTGSHVLENRILPILIESGEESAIDRARRILNASHELPSGAIGNAWREHVFYEMNQLAKKVHHALSNGSIRLPFTLEILAKWPSVDCALFGSYDRVLDRDATMDNFSLYGSLRQLTPVGQIIYRYARPGARDYISAWLAHLVYCEILPNGPRRTLWFGSRNSAFELVSVKDPLQYLSSLVALFRAGQRMPLPFFPIKAWNWIANNKTKSSNFLKNYYLTDELRNPELETAWRGMDLSLLNDTFFVLAKSIFEPLVEHLIEV